MKQQNKSPHDEIHTGAETIPAVNEAAQLDGIWRPASFGAFKHLFKEIQKTTLFLCQQPNLTYDETHVIRLLAEASTAIVSLVLTVTPESET